MNLRTLEDNALGVSVILGPQIDLHPGVHAALSENPPRGIQYIRETAEHAFLMPVNTSSPHETFHFGEFITFHRTAPVVHSSRWPVLGASNWVVDTDDFGYQMLCGRYGINPAFGLALRGPRTSEFKAAIRRRVEVMLGAFCHPSCKGVLFRSQAAADEAVKWMERLRMGQFAECYQKKIRVLYPAQTEVEEDRVYPKWQDGRPMRVLFCGYDHHTKNGAMAIGIFAEVARAYPTVEFIYVGVLPPGEHRVPQNVLLKGPLGRDEVLSTMESAHILFHPSEYEGLGTVLIEAAARGLALIVGAGMGMEHTPELFGTGAMYVDRDLVPKEAQRMLFMTHLTTLLGDRDQARSCGLHNFNEASHGPFSLTRRNHVLEEVYGCALEDQTAVPLTREYLLSQSEGLFPLSLSSAELRADEQRYRHQIGMQSDRVILEALVGA